MATVSADELLEARLSELARDPMVIVRRRSATKPFTPVIQATEHADILELIGRRGDDEDAVGSSTRA